MKKLTTIVLILIISIQSVPAVSVYAQEASSSAVQDQEASNSAELTPTPSPLLTITPEELTGEVAATGSSLTERAILKLEEGKTAGTSALRRGKTRIRSLLKKNFTASEFVMAVVDYSNENTHVSVANAAGEDIEISIHEEQINDSSYYYILPPTTEFTPGKYTLEITSDDESFKQDFTWGVLAINTTKSVYTPGETAQFDFAVLNESGNMVCDAGLELRITNNELGINDTLSVDNKKIQVNPECSLKDFVEKADYEASYKVGGVGVYNLELTATTPNGEYSITDKLEVVDSVKFDITRDTNTRIYPPKAYPVVMSITAQEDFSGTVTETVPANFAISQVSSGSGSIIDFNEVYESKPALENPENVLGISHASLSLPFEGDHGVTLHFGDELVDPLLIEKYNEFGVAGHDGIDFDLPKGTSVLAVGDGKVVLAEEDHDYGTTIVIQHEWGKSYYGHLDKMDVEEGDEVTRGDKIGESGDTGLSTGPHLHFGIKPNKFEEHNGYYGKVDPIEYLGLIPDKSVLGASVSSSEEKKIVTWNLDLKKGETAKIGYQYNAPLESPQAYQLGPLTFVDNSNAFVFKESRRWQIAADVVGTMTDTFLTTNTWIAPTGVTSVDVEAWGGGGGGAGSTTDNDGGNAGGGGGAYAKSTIAVTAGNSYAITIGAAGTAGTAGGGAGGDSGFGDNSQILADGGTGAGTGNTANGTGGSLASTISNVAEFAGGDGGDGGATTIGSGGGGGSAGSTGAGGTGGNGSATTGGTAGAAGSGGGTAGGAGVYNAAGVNGNAGTVPGSGGSGASVQGTTNRSGGAGAAGLVTVTYSANFPKVESRSTGRTTTVDTTSHVITMPSGITAGNLLVIIFSVDGIPTASIASGGWSKLGQTSDGTNVVTQAIFYKVAAGGDTATVTTTAAEQSSHVVLNISGAGSTITGTAASGSSTNSNPPSHDAGSAKNYLWLATRAGDSTVVATAPPTNFANLETLAAAGTGGASSNSSERLANASTLDPGTFTSATEQWVCYTIAVPPPDAPTSPTLYNVGGSSQLAFNNTNQNSTTPTVRVSATFGSTFDRFQVEFNSAADFSGTAYTQTFSSTYSSGTEYDLLANSLSPSLPTTNGVTYYVRARASANGGSDYGDWSSGTWSYTYKNSGSTPDWLQTTDAQFNTGTLSGTQTTGSNSVEVEGSSTISFVAARQGTSLTTAEPTGTQENDIVLALYSNEVMGGAAPTPATGYSLVGTFDTDACGVNVLRMGVYWARRGASPIATNWNDGGAAGRISLITYRGATDTGNPVEASNYDEANSTTVVNDGVTTISDNAMVVGLSAQWNWGTQTSTMANERMDSGQDQAMYDNGLKASAGATGTFSFTGPGCMGSTVLALTPDGATSGTIMSPEVDYDSVVGASSWGQFSWTENTTNGSISYQLYYTASTACDTIVPDGALLGNSTGFSSSPVDISGLNTTTYNKICLKATLTDSGGSPFLESWTVTWDASSDTPTTAQLLRHGAWFNASGVLQPFTF